MQIIIENLGKKFRNEWIFRRLNYTFETGNTYAVIGANGSGKSTLLQVISQFIPANEGEIKFINNNSAISIDTIYKYIAYSSPLLELIEDFTLFELVQFHQKLKPFDGALSTHQFIEKIDLQNQTNKQIKFFSSGMRQKVKLGLCLFSNAEVLFLDEPTTNLDQNTKNWFLENIKLINTKKLVILASNDPFEYSFTTNIIDIQQFKS